jgi:hypothetical protein
MCACFTGVIAQILTQKVLRQVVLNAANTLTGQALVQIAAARGINTVAVMTQQPGFAMISGHLKSCGALCYIDRWMDGWIDR